jgi:APA family basic amino acid/polyamine antiporter
LGPGAAFLMSVIALFATGNTILILLIVASRMVYGISKDGSLPLFLSRVHHKTRTPHIAVLAIMIAGVGFVLVGDMALIANVTTTSVFVSFVFVNVSLIVLRYREPKMERPFKIPINIGKFPIIALLGLLTSIVMLAYTNIMILMVEALLLFLGFIIYDIYKRTTVNVKVKVGVDLEKNV